VPVGEVADARDEVVEVLAAEPPRRGQLAHEGWLSVGMGRC
jgi:hypothetical protein